MIRRVTGAFFSPCGNVEKVVRAMAEAAGARLGVPAGYADITLPGGRAGEIVPGEDALLILGTPVYAGRAPNKLAPYLAAHVRGTGWAVPVVCFGNRSFDNALAELAAILTKGGLRLAGAAAVVTEHSFSSRLAPGSPTAEELAVAAAFAAGAAEDAQAGRALNAAAVPGDADAPYYTPLTLEGTPARFLKAVPTVDKDKCVRCGTCGRVCPMGSVGRDDPAAMTGVCIKCQACVKRCPAGARQFTDETFLSHVRMLERDYVRPAGSVYIRAGEAAR